MVPGDDPGPGPLPVEAEDPDRIAGSGLPVDQNLHLAQWRLTVDLQMNLLSPIAARPLLPFPFETVQIASASPGIQVPETARNAEKRPLLLLVSSNDVLPF